MTTLRSIAAFAIAGSLSWGGANAARLDMPAIDDQIVLAQSDCYSIGEQVAAQNGGTLAKASEQTRGGQAVCVIVVLVPGKDGQRPRRTEIVVPQG